ncbi:PepSY domain-containing protein [Herbaspirillum sp. YR522]|uniref:PepSY-associated TM helix domain-containing protein n=1 Tax=Herbaspirillum sp. YR522 TaxID=1144342 RepID=UPI00026FCCFE|nr:PepSY-associated TM helix domain-containing protein [Herbaspirillum sp. YR522]EJN08617.1 putative iron-regulated membrane protein [Herbaspirillum sp. YR522]
MREGFRQSMAWLHTWSGLLVCWVLLLVFSAGTASYFKEEITLWMTPELHVSSPEPVSQQVALQHAVAHLERNAADAQRWFITLPAERSSAMRVGWVAQPPKDGAKGNARGRFTSEILDPATGQKRSAARDTRGGEFLYRLHFDLHYMPVIWARWIVSICALFMLVAIVSGIITHKRIFKDFFTFRPGKGQRSWLDAHNATAVLALPYHLMITYTGLITLMFMIMPWGIQSAYKEQGENTFFAEVFPTVTGRDGQAGGPARLAALAPIAEQAQAHWNGAPLATIVVNHPGHENASVVITRQRTRTLSYLQPAIVFDGVTGAQTSAAGDDPSAVAVTRGALYGLHMAHFADAWLRVLFFICGLSGCIMVASGALLWAVKTRQKQAKALAQGAARSFGLRLVDALNIGAIAGLPIAFAAYFWANRLLPVDLPQRPQMEINCFFTAWAISAVLAQLRPSMGMWRWQLSAGAAMLIGIPILNAVTTHSHLGVTLLQGRGPWSVAGFDITVLLLGIALACVVRVLHRREKKRAKLPPTDKVASAKLKEAA